MKRYISIVLLCMLSPVFAAQILSVKDNATIVAHIAPFDVNRIFVEGDRIKQVRGVEGTYVLQQDIQAGQIFIKPTSLSKQAFTIFITTETNKNYQLRLFPTLKTAQTLMLKPLHSSTFTEQPALSLIRAMLNEEESNFNVQTFSSSKALYLSPHIEITLLKKYEGDSLIGECYRVENKNEVSLTFTESQFYRPGTVAIALDSLTLLPHTSTTLYTVTYAQP